jgi:hypothetical protein
MSNIRRDTRAVVMSVQAHCQTTGRLFIAFLWPKLRGVVTVWDGSLLRYLQQQLDRYDEWQTARSPHPACSKSIICTCRRRNCPGRDLSVRVFISRLAKS